MSFLDLLKAHWTIGGLTAPKFAWCAAIVLIVAPFSVLVRLWWIVRKRIAGTYEGREIDRGVKAP